MSIELSIGPRGINHERDFRRGNEFRLDLSTIHLREERFFGCTGMEGLKFMCAMPRGIYTVMTGRRGLHLVSVAIVCMCVWGWLDYNNKGIPEYQARRCSIKVDGLQGR